MEYKRMACNTDLQRVILSAKDKSYSFCCMVSMMNYKFAWKFSDVIIEELASTYQDYQS